MPILGAVTGFVRLAKQVDDHPFGVADLYLRIILRQSPSLNGPPKGETCKHAPQDQDHQSHDDKLSAHGCG
jgi:hypothetical protein